MKKITLLFFTFLAFQIANSQDSCSTAVAITAGTTTVGTINGTVPTPVCAANGPVPAVNGPAGEWYSYTATVDGIANINSFLPQNPANGDTRFHVYSGTCGSLVCIGGNDDINGAATGGNYYSDGTFAVSVGVTYIIAWDNRWSSLGFDFTLTETAVSCSTASPYSYDFSSINPLIACYEIENTNSDATTWGYNNGNDFNGDMVNDGVALVFPAAANVTKDDWLFLPVFNGVANAEYSISVVYNAFNNPSPAASESFEIVVLDTPSSTATSQTQIGNYSGITQSGMLASLEQNAYTSTASYTPTADGDFYFAIHATTPGANSGILILFNLSVDETLGVDEFESNTFSHYYSKNTDILTLKSSELPFDNVQLFNVLGQNVMQKSLSQTSESLNLSQLQDGIYLIKVGIQGNNETFKLLKQ